MLYGNQQSHETSMYQYPLLSKSSRILERPAIPMSNLLSRGVLQDGEEKLAYVDHSLALCFAVSMTLIPLRAQICGLCPPCCWHVTSGLTGSFLVGYLISSVHISREERVGHCCQSALVSYLSLFFGMSKAFPNLLSQMPDQPLTSSLN